MTRFSATQLFNSPVSSCFYLRNQPVTRVFPSLSPSNIRAFDFIAKIRPLENSSYRLLSGMIVKSPPLFAPRDGNRRQGAGKKIPSNFVITEFYQIVI